MGTTTTVDDRGNALGGVRTPFIDVPTGVWYGNAATSISENLICYLAGYEAPFDKDQLKSLYPTHDYVQRFTESANAAVDARFLLREDAEGAIAEAANAAVP